MSPTESLDIDESKTQIAEKTIAALHHENGEPAPIVAEGSPVNGFLIFACVTFAAASFLFGYDDKVISPIMALEPFVSVPLGPPSPRL